MTENKTLLSICVPTYNRCESLKELLSLLLMSQHNFEVVIVVDGSTDVTMSYLSQLSDARLKYIYQENAGRASALKLAISRSTGSFVMIFDDDDLIDLSGLDLIVSDLNTSIPEDVVGYIYCMEQGNSGLLLGGNFPASVCNFFSLRADFGVAGDRKEVVKSDLLKEAMDYYNINDRRIPTSLYWYRLALEHDVICRNVVVGRKFYNSGGMTSSISSLKNDSPSAMVELNKVKMNGFIKGRYKNVRFLIKSLLSLHYYLILYVFKVTFNNSKK